MADEDQPSSAPSQTPTHILIERDLPVVTGVDKRLAVLPNPIVTGICLDCDDSRSITILGACDTCGSKSTLRKGAIKALEDRIAARLENEKKKERRAADGVRLDGPDHNNSPEADWGSARASLPRGSRGAGGGDSSPHPERDTVLGDVLPERPGLRGVSESSGGQQPEVVGDVGGGSEAASSPGSVADAAPVGDQVRNRSRARRRTPRHRIF